MRNALILLAVVALIILMAGAVNNGVAFDVDYVAGSASAVSLFWVSLVIAGVVFVAGLVAAWFALAGAAGSRRKLEAELQTTYQRLREAESAAAKPAPVELPPTPGAGVDEATTVVSGEAATVVPNEAATIVTEEAPEAATIIVPDSAVTEAPADEQTAVTITGAAVPPAADEPAATREDGAPAEGDAPPVPPGGDGAS